MALHVPGDVLVLGLHGLHIGGHLEGQKAGGFGLAGHDIQHSLLGNAEVQQDGVHLVLKFRGDKGVRGVHSHDHVLTVCGRILNNVQIALVFGGGGFAVVGVVLPGVHHLRAIGVLHLNGHLIAADGVLPDIGGIGRVSTVLE